MHALQPDNRLSQLRGAAAARTVLIVVLVASQCLIWWPRAKWGPPATRGISQSPGVTICEGDQYGQAAVSLAGGRPVNAETAAEQLAQQIATAGKRPIELHISGGVCQQQLEPLLRAIRDASGNGQVGVSVTVLDDGDTPYAEPDESNRFDGVATGAR